MTDFVGFRSSTQPTLDGTFRAKGLPDKKISNFLLWWGIKGSQL
ncbi:hypothetical protein [Scytonema sp. NUACC21]